MSMMEYFEAGYKVICGSYWGDVEVDDPEEIECYEECSDLVSVDEEKKEVYFFDNQDYDE